MVRNSGFRTWYSSRVAFVSALLILSAAFLRCDRTTAGAGIGGARIAGESPLNTIAERYVSLALALGEHDPMYIDAYYGTEERREAARREKKPLDAIAADAAILISELDALDPSGFDEMLRLRHEFLAKQIESLAARAAMLGGARYSFDEESEALYDAVAPRRDEGLFEELLARVDSLLPPGEGSLLERLDRFRNDFVIPRERLDTVFAAAIAEARRRTKLHVELPASESFDVVFVTDKPWGAYNWYKGNGHSVIEVNTDLPAYIDSPVGLACHEGYPGHHVLNVLLEEKLARERGWVEFTVYPLFSPQSFIAEGTANFGVEMVFPPEERLAFTRDVLYPLAGLDPARAEAYSAVMQLTKELRECENEAARRYLDGEITAEQSAEYLSKYALMSPERARKLVTFFDRYRSYVVNYGVGHDLVKDYIVRNGGAADRPERRWEIFRELLLSPRVPSSLR